ncbi:unnamed protein product [Amoebophrya sp. A120]|nr:unnamed protein product [Amoebophrya sp. A120]|eukprot:GSA120T00021040001.1
MANLGGPGAAGGGSSASAVGTLLNLVFPSGSAAGGSSSPLQTMSPAAVPDVMTALSSSSGAGVLMQEAATSSIPPVEQQQHRAMLAASSRMQKSFDGLHGNLLGSRNDQMDNPFRQLAMVLDGEDHVGLSFWLASGLMLAALAFFFFQVFLVPRRWANSMVVAGLVCGVAWHHYTEMKDIWASTQRAPTVYRYVDWLVTVPLQVTEFYLILVAANPDDKPPISGFLFFRLLGASLLMLTFGYLGESDVMDSWIAFCIGFLFYAYILYEVFFGEASQISAQLSLDEAKKFLAIFVGSSKKDDDEADLDDEDSGAQRDEVDERAKREAIEKAMNSASGQTAANSVALKEFKKPEAQLAFEIIRIILLFGWMLYPIGYLADVGDDLEGTKTLNAIYNLADLLNKVAFGLAIYYAAGSQNEQDRAIVASVGAPSVHDILEMDTFLHEDDDAKMMNLFVPPMKNSSNVPDLQLTTSASKPNMFGAPNLLLTGPTSPLGGSSNVVAGTATKSMFATGTTGASIVPGVINSGTGTGGQQGSSTSPQSKSMFAGGLGGGFMSSNWEGAGGSGNLSTSSPNVFATSMPTFGGGAS